MADVGWLSLASCNYFTGVACRLETWCHVVRFGIVVILVGTDATQVKKLTIRDGVLTVRRMRRPIVKAAVSICWLIVDIFVDLLSIMERWRSKKSNRCLADFKSLLERRMLRCTEVHELKISPGTRSCANDALLQGCLSPKAFNLNVNENNVWSKQNKKRLILSYVQC